MGFAESLPRLIRVRVSPPSTHTIEINVKNKLPTKKLQCVIYLFTQTLLKTSGARFSLYLSYLTMVLGVIIIILEFVIQYNYNVVKINFCFVHSLYLLTRLSASFKKWTLHLFIIAFKYKCSLDNSEFTFNFAKHTNPWYGRTLNH